MIKLYNAATNDLLGEISDAQLQLLVDQFEEESSSDQDYYINRTTFDMLKDAGADAALLSMLERVLGASGEGDIRWSAE